MSDSLTASAMYTNFDDQHLAKHSFRFPADPYWLSPPQGSFIPIWQRGAAPNYQPKPMICRLKESPVKVWKRLKAAKNGAVRKADEADTAHPGKAVCPVSHNPESSVGELVCPALSKQHVPPPMMRVFCCSSGTTAQRLAVKLEQRLRIMSSHTDEFWAVVSVASVNEFQPDSISAGDAIFIVASCAE